MAFFICKREVLKLKTGLMDNGLEIERIESEMKAIDSVERHIDPAGMVELEGQTTNMKGDELGVKQIPNREVGEAGRFEVGFNLAK